MTLLMGSAVFTRHDAHTRKILEDCRQRRKDGSKEDLLGASRAAEALGPGWVADEIRRIVDDEVERRREAEPGFADWWTHAALGVLP